MSLPFQEIEIATNFHREEGCLLAGSLSLFKALSERILIFMSSKNICVEDVRIYQEAYIYYEIKTTFYIHMKNENLLADGDTWNIIHPWKS